MMPSNIFIIADYWGSVYEEGFPVSFESFSWVLLNIQEALVL